MKTSVKALLVIVVLAIVGAGAAVTYTASKQPYRGVAIEDLAELFHPEMRKFGEIVIKTYREYRANTVRWSAAYYGCLFGAALFSALSALVLKLELLDERPKLRNDLAAGMATLAALLITLSTTGDFQRKWQANRMAAAEVENLAYELTRPSAGTDLDAIVTRIQAINRVRNQMIVGESTESVSEGPLLLPADCSGDRSSACP